MTQSWEKIQSILIDTQRREIKQLVEIKFKIL